MVDPAPPRPARLPGGGENPVMLRNERHGVYCLTSACHKAHIPAHTRLQRLHSWSVRPRSHLHTPDARYKLRHSPVPLLCRLSIISRLSRLSPLWPPFWALASRNSSLSLSSSFVAHFAHNPHYIRHHRLISCPRQSDQSRSHRSRQPHRCPNPVPFSALVRRSPPNTSARAQEEDERVWMHCSGAQKPFLYFRTNHQG